MATAPRPRCSPISRTPSRRPAARRRRPSAGRQITSESSSTSTVADAMPSQVVVLVALAGPAHLAGSYAGRRALAGTLKALPILALAGVAATTDAPVTPRYAGLVTAGLLLSALGDVCLVWPERFTMGLASFLLAHCCYLAAFVLGAGHGGTAWPWLTGIALASGGLLAGLWAHPGPPR